MIMFLDITFFYCIGNLLEPASLKDAMDDISAVVNTLFLMGGARE
jgi:hypothetical protein